MSKLVRPCGVSVNRGVTSDSVYVVFGAVQPANKPHTHTLTGIQTLPHATVLKTCSATNCNRPVNVVSHDRIMPYSLCPPCLEWEINLT